MLFIADLDYTTKASTSKKITTINIGLQNEMLLQCCRTFEVAFETSRDQGNSVGGTAVHIWLCMRNEGGWVSINDLMYGHIFNDNRNRITREAEQGNYLEEILAVRYRRCCQAVWYSKKTQNRVRFQIAAPCADQ